jgi:hypothetical protein
MPGWIGETNRYAVLVALASDGSKHKHSCHLSPTITVAVCVGVELGGTKNIGE